MFAIYRLHDCSATLIFMIALHSRHDQEDIRVKLSDKPTVRANTHSKESLLIT